jgi:hypothetical protein
MMIRTLIFLMLCLASNATAVAAQQEWRFRVFLDDREIGTHDFVMRERENQLRVRSEANFEVRLLFVKLFEYQHENVETWSGNCLTAIESRTEANGKPFTVKGELRDDRFVLNGSAGTAELPGCNMSFAYWNPAFLGQQRLINVQNGEVLDIEVSEPEIEEIEVRGRIQTARRYRLKAGEMKIELWYSQDDEWLALETDARGGRRLRYVLI